MTALVIIVVGIVTVALAYEWLHTLKPSLEKEPIKKR